MEQSEISIENIMAEIRREISDKHLTPDMPDFEDVPYDAPAAVDGFGVDAPEARAALGHLHTHYQLQPYKPLSGNPVKVFLQKIIRRLIRFYIEPLAADQTELNASAVRMLSAVDHTLRQEDPADLRRRIEVLELRQKQSDAAVSALRQELAALHRAR